jgi:hypothetical protein
MAREKKGFWVIEFGQEEGRYSQSRFPLTLPLGLLARLGTAARNETAGRYGFNGPFNLKANHFQQDKKFASDTRNSKDMHGFTKRTFIETGHPWYLTPHHTPSSGTSTIQHQYH